MNRKSLLSDAMGLTLSKVIVSGISIITTMLLSRFRTLSDYGTYSQLLVISNIGINFFFLGMPNSINYFLPRAENNSQKRTFCQHISARL